MILFPMWVGDWHMPNFAVPIALGLAALASWARAIGCRLSAVFGAILDGFGAYHAGAYVWLFASGEANYLLGSDIRAAFAGPGVYLALAASLIALTVSVSAWRDDRRRRAAAKG